MAKKATAAGPAVVKAIEAGLTAAEKAVEALIPTIPSLTTDDIRERRLINDLGECVHRIGRLNERVRAADRIARRGARVKSA